MTTPPRRSHQSLVFRPAENRFHSVSDWLDSWHSFSFAGHHHPDWMGFGPLRVINDDTISAGRGFGMHSHQDMEIITVMIEGKLTHQDSTGQRGVIQAGDVQRMSAGTGIMHSETNESDQACRLLQIWIEPNRSGLAPAYEQRRIALTDHDWTSVLDPNRNDCMAIERPMQLWRTQIAHDETIHLPELFCHQAWMQMIEGHITLSNQNGSTILDLYRGDGVGFHPLQSGMSQIRSHRDQTDLLLFALN